MNSSGNSGLSGITSDLFRLNNKKVSKKRKNIALKALHKYQFTQKKSFLGYQVNQDIDYSTNLSEYLDIALNNVGDPFVPGNLTTNTKFVEKEVLDYYARLWNNKAPYNPNDKNSYWGYMVSMGCTEGNIYGFMSGRDYLEGKYLLVDEESEKRAKRTSIEATDRECLVGNGFKTVYGICKSKNKNAFSPVAFFSQDAHYSIVKATEILKMPSFNTLGNEEFQGECPLKYPKDYPKNFSKEYIDDSGWPKEVPSDENGSIYIPALVKLVRFFAKRGYPIFVSFNYGSTFKGAYDNVKEAVKKLVPVLKKYGLYEREIVIQEENNKKQKKDTRNGFWFHVDGALGAAYMPYLEVALRKKLIDKPYKEYKFPIFDFRIKEIHSLAVSGHKWVGSPWPSGIYMSKVKYQLKPITDPMYIGSPDTTFAGSRNGFSPLIFWDHLSQRSKKDHIKEIVKCEKLAQKTYEELIKLKKYGVEWVERSPFSLTIRFKQPNKKIVFKYSLSTEALYVNGKQRDYAHIYIMEHVTQDLINNLIKDLKSEFAYKN